MDGIIRKKKHTDTIRDLTIEDVDDFGVRYQVFSNILIENVVVKNSPNARQAFRFHNSDKRPALEVDGASYNLILRHCDVENVKGDGIYATAVNGALIENCKVVISSGAESDACQFAYERDDRNISRNILLRGNVFTLRADTQSAKGAVVCQKTIGYRVENNHLEGRNFCLSSIGDQAVVRSNVMRGARMNDYSSGYMIGEQGHVSDHHVYDNRIEDCTLGFGLSSFRDAEIRTDDLQGYQRSDMDIHDNVIADCDVGFMANRAWSGAFRRNILMRCMRETRSAGSGSRIATLGAMRTQTIVDNYTNDGTFLNVEPPILTFQPDGTASVSSGRWTSEPYEIRLYWRDRGRDIPGANHPVFRPEKGMELSCVVLARRDDNWMLAVAEAPWPETVLTPRAHLEGAVSWAKRYFDV